MGKNRIRRGFAWSGMVMLLLAGCRPAGSPDPAGESRPYPATWEQQEETGQQEAKEESSSAETANPETEEETSAPSLVQERGRI